jgi:hypothetical protein
MGDVPAVWNWKDTGTTRRCGNCGGSGAVPRDATERAILGGLPVAGRRFFHLLATKRCSSCKGRGTIRIITRCCSKATPCPIHRP